MEGYKAFVGHERLENIKRRCERLQGKKIVLVNSTANGGGVAQILQSITPFLQRHGLDIEWHVIQPEREFFEFTKKLHNGLQGQKIKISSDEKNMYEANLHVAAQTLPEADFHFIHDPQPAGIASIKELNAALRIHIDISEPNPEALRFLKRYIDQYKELIVTHPSYLQKSLTKPHRIIEPATDPFTDINRELTQDEEEELQQRIPSDRYIAQVSRFDPWKDPVGVIDLFEKLHEKDQDIDLVLLGGEADDDPEGQKIYEEVLKRRNESHISEKIYVIKETNPLLVNYVQRNAEVIIQKSTKEGFGLTVSEALLKGTPVAASRVGGIPRQVKQDVTGYLADPKDYDAFVKNILHLLQDKDNKERITRQGTKYVKKNFLLPRLAEDYLSLFEDHL